MEDLKYLGIIPARYASTRFPGKPLALIDGISMIERVYRQVSIVLDRVFVATDDTRIYDAVLQFGGNVVMTSTSHRSGTDRCREAYQMINDGEDVVINIQGDEPFIQPSQIREIMACFNDTSTDIATLVRRFDSAGGYAKLEDPNTPKVIIDKKMNAKYFSRSVIPYIRGYEKNEWTCRHDYYVHVGMYAYRSSVLDQITELPQSSLEISESLEQLRWLENGYSIKVGITACETIGIDTPEDLKNAEKLIRNGEI